MWECLTWRTDFRWGDLGTRSHSGLNLKVTAELHAGCCRKGIAYSGHSQQRRELCKHKACLGGGRGLQHRGWGGVQPSTALAGAAGPGRRLCSALYISGKWQVTSNLGEGRDGNRTISFLSFFLLFYPLSTKLWPHIKNRAERQKSGGRELCQEAL